MLHNIETFAKSRGFEPKELTKYGVRARDENHIIIPTLGRDRIWYERTRCASGCHPKYEGPKGQELHLYNPLGLGPHVAEVWLAEGELDTLSLITVGAPGVGVLGTNGFNRHWASLFEGAEIVIAFDPDEAGRSQAEKLAQLWPASQVSFFDPSPYGDLNDWFKEDREGFTEAVLGW